MHTCLDYVAPFTRMASLAPIFRYMRRMGEHPQLWGHALHDRHHLRRICPCKIPYNDGAIGIGRDYVYREGLEHGEPRGCKVTPPTIVLRNKCTN